MASGAKHRGNLATDPKVSRAKGIRRVTLTYDRDNMMCYFYSLGIRFATKSVTGSANHRGVDVHKPAGLR